MTDTNTAEQLEIEACEENVEESHIDSNVRSVISARLLKLQHSIKALREEVYTNYTKEIKECKSAFVEANNDLVGELHGVTRGEEQS